ncbi:MAG: PBECR4 domain-containing protein [Eubacteriales bacterium]|nr:PBECR4 domain-containing protein [Eubacteriales bacterium]
MSEHLSTNHRNTLRETLITGAEMYTRYLCDREFKILCDDGTSYTVEFVRNEFLHLSGIKTDLSKSSFYDACYQKTLSSGNILEEQKYDWSTLKKKARKLARINEFLHQNGDKTLLLECLQTNTMVFPLAIRNDATNICMAFITDRPRAHSLRNASNSQTATSIKPIVAILAKPAGSNDFSEKIYISTVGEQFLSAESRSADVSDTSELTQDPRERSVFCEAGFVQDQKKTTIAN